MTDRQQKQDIQQSAQQQYTTQMHRRWMMPLVVFLIVTLGCSAADLVQRVDVTPTAIPPTRPLAPTFTPTPGSEQSIVIVTPPAQGTPGVIIIPPGMDPSSVIPTPIPTATPEPTETAPATPGTPALTAAPPAESTPLEPGAVPEQPAATASAPPPTATPSPTPSATPLPTLTATPVPTLTPTFTPSPTPFVRVESGLVSLRTGPGVQYPLVAQLGPGIPVAIVGQNPEGTWYQICCVNGESVWVALGNVTVVNDASQTALVLAEPPPTPTPTFTPTLTPTVTPTPTATPYPFERAIGPQFFPTNNEFLTIWAKLFVGPIPDEVPAEGYYLEVLFEGFDRPNTNVERPSSDQFEWSAPQGAGNRVEYNYKYEYKPPDPEELDPASDQTRIQLLGTGTWTVYVTDGAGNQLSPEVTFTTNPNNANREVYIGWIRVR